MDEFADIKLVGLLVDEFSKLRKATVSFIRSVCLFAWNNSAPTGGIYMKFDIWVFFRNLLRKFKVDYNLTSITGTSHEDLWTFITIILNEGITMCLEFN